jgi:hypothetical protein
VGLRLENGNVKHTRLGGRYVNLLKLGICSVARVESETESIAFNACTQFCAAAAGFCSVDCVHQGRPVPGPPPGLLHPRSALCGVHAGEKRGRACTVCVCVGGGRCAVCTRW